MIELIIPVASVPSGFELISPNLDAQFNFLRQVVQPRKSAYTYVCISQMSDEQGDLSYVKNI